MSQGIIPGNDFWLFKEGTTKVINLSQPKVKKEVKEGAVKVVKKREAKAKVKQEVKVEQVEKV